MEKFYLKDAAIMQEGIKKYCPDCGKRECEPTGSGFIEIGEYDQTKDVYEQEGNVTEYTCKACGTTFFAW